MGNGSGVSRGDRNRNARLERLRALVPVTNAIAGIDLAGSASPFNSDLQVNRQASLCDEFGGAQSSK